MYKVLENFYDKDDNRYHYIKGDSYPRKGVESSKKRIEELSTSKNAAGRPLIKKKRKKKEDK